MLKTTDEINRPKTREDVDKLMTNWYQDPIWDLHETEGFEEYRDELLDYETAMKEKWRIQTEELNKKREAFEYNLKFAIQYTYDNADHNNPTITGIAHALIAIAIALDKFQQDVERIQG